MDTCCNKVTPHPAFLDFLFAFKKKTSSVFRDILGIHDLAHLAITQVSTGNHLLTLSSTPSLEFNLFSSPLWHYDRSYDPAWFSSPIPCYWHQLYHPERYDELYYLKQIKHQYALGLSLATALADKKIIYSLAIQHDTPQARELFSCMHDDFYKIGQYCFNLLEPLFTQTLQAPLFQKAHRI